MPTGSEGALDAAGLKREGRSLEATLLKLHLEDKQVVCIPLGLKKVRCNREVQRAYRLRVR